MCNTNFVSSFHFPLDVKTIIKSAFWTLIFSEKKSQCGFGFLGVHNKFLKLLAAKIQVGAYKLEDIRQENLNYWSWRG